MQETLEKIHRELDAALDEAGVDHHMHYGPVSDKYWSERLKILLINLEPYGYQDNGRLRVDRSCLLDWAWDKGATRTRTVRYTLATAAALLRCYDRNETLIPETIKEAYQQPQFFEDALDRTCYYNIRADSHTQKAQRLGIPTETLVDLKFAALKAEFDTLEPDLIIVSGIQATAILNRVMLLTDNSLSYLGQVMIGKTRLVSVRHFSRPRYRSLVGVLESVRLKL